MNERAFIRSQALAMRQLADAMLLALEDDMAEDPLEPAPPCEHPLKQRRPAGVMGDPARYFCTACEQFVGRPAPAGAEPPYEEEPRAPAHTD